MPAILMTQPASSPSRLEDGCRIFIESGAEGLDFHKRYRAIGPPAAALFKYERGKISRDQLMMRYRKHLRKNKCAKDALKDVLKRALASRVTILCRSEEPEGSFRELVAEEIRRIAGDSLTISIK